MALKGEKRGPYRDFVGKRQGKTPTERPRRKWECNVKMDLPINRMGAWTAFIWLRIGTGDVLL